MKTFGLVVLGLTGLACLVALVGSAVPGVLQDLAFVGLLLFFLALFVVPVLAILAVIGLHLLQRKGRLALLRRSLRVPWREVAVTLMVLIATYGLLRLQVPRRIAFRFSRPGFERAVGQAPAAADGAVLLDRRLGLYHVDEVATDPRGGVYFRVYTAAWDIGPDQTSYGFVYRPNGEGSPFGAAGYRVVRLSGDWHWFSACDDW